LSETFVTTADRASNVRCTGHFSAISISLSAVTASTPPSTLITLEAINLAGPTVSSCTAILAVRGGQLAVPDNDANAAECELFVLGIDPESHGGARAQSCCQIVVGVRSAIEAARRCGLVGPKTMAASSDCILESSERVGRQLRHGLCQRGKPARPVVPMQR
jgi:hypothetical protein